MEQEMAQLMYKLAYSKRNWGSKFDRLEHYKRFPNLKKIVKLLTKREWILFQKKPTYDNISLNPKYKKEILDFIEEYLGVLR